LTELGGAAKSRIVRELKERPYGYKEGVTMRLNRLAHLKVSFAIALISAALTTPAFAAVCANGKPVVPRTPLGNAYCQCLDKNPAGTQVYTLEGMTVRVVLAKNTFEHQFSYDAATSCDASHLYVTDVGDPERHAYPLSIASISLGPIGDQPILPKDQPDLEIIRLTILGHARYVKTI
jgi:hypothetical protein